MMRKETAGKCGATSGLLAAADAAGRHTHTEKAAAGSALQRSGGIRNFGMKRLALFDGAADGGKADASGL